VVDGSFTLRFVIPVAEWSTPQQSYGVFWKVLD